jgi:hypothetical protein
MRSFLLMLSIFLCAQAYAQDTPVNQLPAGKYETVAKNASGRWSRGDIHLLDNSRYRLSNEGEAGEYRFSVTAQRVFFTSGPLKGVFAKTSLQQNQPAIMIPYQENQHLGNLSTASDIVGILRN